ncbi:MAG: hypothetical protein ACHBN1_05150 [Heteroscytonema crispum UTEX LB 1556]
MGDFRASPPTTNQRPFGRTSTRRETRPQYALHHQPPTNDPSGEPVLGGKPDRSTRFTTNH